MPSGSVASENPDWLRPAPDGVFLRVRVGPRAARAGLVGVHGPTLRVRVTAPPVGGAANRELLEVLAAALGVHRSALSLEAGAQSREKRIRVRGVSPEGIRARVAAGLRVDSAGGQG